MVFKSINDKERSCHYSYQLVTLLLFLSCKLFNKVLRTSSLKSHITQLAIQLLKKEVPLLKRPPNYYLLQDLQLFFSLRKEKKSTSTLKSSFKKFTSLAEWHLHLHAENCVKLKSQGKGRWCLLVHFVTTDFIYEPAWGFLQFNCRSRICFLCQCIFHWKEQKPITK